MNPLNLLFPCRIPRGATACAVHAGWLFLTLPGLASAQSSPAPSAGERTSVSADHGKVGGAGTVSGRVVNEATGEFLKYAVVQQVGGDRSTTAGPGGEFTLPNLPAGEVRLRVSYTGLDSVEATVSVDPSQTTTHDFALSSKVYDEKNTLRLGEFVVTTEREGQAKALMDQRASLNSKSVISTEAYGQITDGNVAEFLRYLPGMTIDYRESDVAYVRIRGFEPQYTGVMIDGNPIANTASSNITGAAFGGRATEFEAMSINNIETIEVTKVPLADADASSGAGVVNMKSRRAFDRKGRSITLDASAVANSLFPITLHKIPQPKNTTGYAFRPNYSLNYSDVFLKNRLGIVAGLSFQKTINMMERASPNWQYNGIASDNATEVPRLNVEFKDGAKTVVRRNAALNLDYKISPFAFVGFRYNYSDFDTWVYDRLAGWEFNAFDPSVNNTFTSQQTNAGNNNNTVLLRGGYFHKVTDTTNLSFPFEYKRGSFTVDGSLARSRSNNHYSNPKNWSVPFSDGSATPPDLRLRGIQYSVSIPDPLKPNYTFTQIAGPDYRSLTNYPTPFVANVGPFAKPYTNYFTEGPQTSQDTVYSASTNLRYNKSEWRFPTLFRAGFSDRERSYWVEKPQRRYTFSGTTNILGGLAENNFPLMISDFTNFAPQFVDRAALAKYIQTNPGSFVETEDGRAEAVTNLLRNRQRFKERIDGYYTMAQIKVGRLDIIPGLRFEKSTVSGRSYQDIGDRETRRRLGLTALPTGQTTPTTDAASPYYTVAYRQTRYGDTVAASGGTHDVFKNLQFRYRATGNLQILAAYRESVQRPSPGNLLPGVTAINPDGIPYPTATINNPDLKPEYGKTYNIGATYYFEPAGVVSVYGFRQNFRNKVTRDTNLNAASSFIAGPEGVYGDTDLAGYLVNQPTNVDAPVHMTGMEFEYAQRFSFLPKPFNGLGVRTSYTYLHPDNRVNFYGSKPHTASGSLSYRYRRVSTQVNATWSGGFKSGYNRTTDIANFRGQRTQIDWNLNVDLAKNLQAYLVGKNVTNAPETEYLANALARSRVLRSYTVFGATWQIGAKLRF